MTDILEPVLTGDEAANRLHEACPEFLHLPGTPGYDTGRQAWNVATSQWPAAVAVPETVDQVSRLVRNAGRVGLRVTAQTTGHAAAVLAAHRLSDVVLVRTGKLRGVHVDPVAKVARVEAGATWEDVIDAAAPHGLTALHGSAPDIGVVGYSLGGGLGWYARKHGLAANSLVAVELVTADGEVVRADATQNTDLFWALRGGGGNFGIVTTVEVALLPVADAYAGMMLWDGTHAPAVLRAWAEWSRTAPEEVTTSFRVMRFPPLPELPPFLSGRTVVILDGAALLDDDAAEETLAAFRALGPEMDTWARVPSASLIRLHMDPEDPTPSVGASATLSELDEAAVEAFLAAVGPDADTPVFLSELRQLGGALARSAAGAGALDRIEGTHLAFFVAMAMTPEMGALGQAALGKVLDHLAPWDTGRPFLNLAERSVETRTAFAPEAWDRLCAVRRQVDPRGVFLANHSI